MKINRSKEKSGHPFSLRQIRKETGEQMQVINNLHYLISFYREAKIYI